MKSNVEKIKDYLEHAPSLEFAYLFGSRAKNNAISRSDWDLGIYFKKANLETNFWHDFMVQAELSLLLKSEVQIITLNNRLSPLLGFEIVKHGRVLVSKNKDAILDYENRILRRYFDWDSFSKRNRNS